jgi:membrane-bound lytic murein transglycosylase MltF
MRRTRIVAALVTLSMLAVSPALADEPVTDEMLKLPDQVWLGDFDGMVERRMIRVLMPFSKMLYFLDGADQRGISYEIVQQMEKWLNEKLDTGSLKLNLVIIPTPRDRLIPGLLEGRGDIAMGNLTITPERQEQVDFSAPMLTGVSEILITGPGSPPLASVDDLSGREVCARKSSSYYTSLIHLNEKLEAAGKAPVRITPADESLEDDDLIEMVNAGILPAIIVDDHKANFWAQIFEDVVLHPGVAVNSGGSIGWAFRKDSPKLAAELNAFVKTIKKGTLMGNILFKRYLKNTSWARKVMTPADRARFDETMAFFRQYAAQYGFDWFMVAALAYQESRLDQSLRSPAGAIGVMQLLPSTASDPNVGIRNIEKTRDNIHAGVKYLRFLKDRYFSDGGLDPLDQTLFTFAAYNAGPAKVRRLRAEARGQGLDPNVWFQNVEVIAAKRIGRETVQYVSNIFKYYVAYRSIATQDRFGAPPPGENDMSNPTRS